MAHVISVEQTTFIVGRNITDVIHQTQELLHEYHLDKGPARCAVKVDLCKAFDTVNWGFIITALEAIGILANMVGWIQECIMLPYFSIGMNGSLFGFFKATRGLRQGGPLSLYLFILTMEGLSGIMKRASCSNQYRYHWRCRKNQITHLNFADNLMLFCHGDIQSVGIIKDSMDEFMKISGLSINYGKISLFTAGIAQEE